MDIKKYFQEKTSLINEQLDCECKRKWIESI